MARGEQKLFKDLFTDVLVESEDKTNRGRSKTHDTNRNELLIARYYYYGKFTDKRYSKILSDLESEFFLSQARIQVVINDHYSKLKELSKSQPDRQWFKKKWVHFNWA